MFSGVTLGAVTSHRDRLRWQRYPNLSITACHCANKAVIAFDARTWNATTSAGMTLSSLHGRLPEANGPVAMKSGVKLAGACGVARR